MGLDARQAAADLINRALKSLDATEICHAGSNPFLLDVNVQPGIQITGAIHRL
jgi:hypothetical protein